MMKYRGRFAPSPTGPLHFGSLVAALGSWLDARSNNGEWLVRIEDIDPPREVAGASDEILRTLEYFGLYWDQQVTYQSDNLEYYHDILDQLISKDIVYCCVCTRKQIKTTNGIYQNSCRYKDNTDSEKHSLRLKVMHPVLSFQDYFHGQCKAKMELAKEDYILKRKDGLYAYMLAVVLDDYRQNISHVIRGADLLDTTVQQIYLFNTLNAPVPQYGHLPLVVNNLGKKMSKQNQAPAIQHKNVAEQLWQALDFLKQAPPVELHNDSKENILNWATQHWDPDTFKAEYQLVYHDK